MPTQTTHTHAQGDYNKAGKVYEENCAKYSHPPSCFNLGRLYRTFGGESGCVCQPVDSPCAIRSFLGHLSTLAVGGRGVPQSDVKSLKCFGAYGLTTTTFHPVFWTDRPIVSVSSSSHAAPSAAATDKSCQGGHGMACHHMGLLLLYGKDGGYDVQQVL